MLHLNVFFQISSRDMNSLASIAVCILIEICIWYNWKKFCLCLKKIIASNAVFDLSHVMSVSSWKINIQTLMQSSITLKDTWFVMKHQRMLLNGL